MSAIIFQIQSFLIVGLFYFGVSKRKNRKLHIKIMSSAIIWDIILILQIELNRGAIKKASQAVTNPMMLNIHVSLALTCVILYIVMFYTGIKVMKGNNKIKAKHKFFGITTLVARTLVLVTSFWAMS
jgi:uncharacterized membrane protein YozB (DUF420 family)